MINIHISRIYDINITNIEPSMRHETPPVNLKMKSV